MKNTVDLTLDSYRSLIHCLEWSSEISLEMVGGAAEQLQTTQTYWNGVLKYVTEFMTPYSVAFNSFCTVEREKLVNHPPWESIR